ncbi:MAG: DUF1566 domain-containing protein [Ilumatobacteraceae bacterium]
MTDPACSCTASSAYWSATTSAPSPPYAWLVDFASGNTGSASKFTDFHVRAVRAGS